MKNKSVLYIEIAETIKKDIQNSIYPVGTLLPTESDFEKLFDVSKITVRKAVEQLANQGFVEKKSGKGTTVISNRLFNKVSKGEAFSTILEKKGMAITKEIASIEQSVLTKESTYYQYFGDKCTHVVRLYRLDGEPYIIFNHFLPSDVYDDIQNKINKVSLYQLLANKGYQIDRFNDQFSICNLNNEEKKLLETSQTHVLKRTRHSFDERDQVIEVSVAQYDTDKTPYEIEFEI